ncbi:MAG TPA: methyltransferase [Pseudomonas xinjiangensis]|uniref:Methyltransferase n=2 Tax=root TaxID=1 RepID=A0A7V1BLZ7_9GAMM|nr:methyltransferase [Halopseudomonas xinjiangensis]HEC48424.1 methyltransferase [Halopseudomonas xinjiangensis]
MDFSRHFNDLDAWLYEHQAIWRARPFTQLILPWEAEHQTLAAFLRGRTLEQAEQVHNQPHLLQAPHPYPEIAAASRVLAALPAWSREPSRTFPESLTRHIPGRKWEQITRFAEISLERLPASTGSWIDWCAGKGHLGRVMAWQTGRPLICLEHNAALNEQGAALSSRCGVVAEHVDADVLTASAWSHMAADQFPVALHACGQLHMTLLEQSAMQGCRQVVLAPCCYNRIDADLYQSMSRAGKQAKLQLTKGDLGLPLLESVTAGQRERRLRDQSMAWRLAFDLWQRESLGTDVYLPTPAKPHSALGQGIADFCRSLAKHHQLDFAEPASWAALEQQGWQRLAQVRNLELVSALFRRPLEIWLLLDRALFMEEAGYAVQLGEFCSTSLTPRNLMLIASK